MYPPRWQIGRPKQTTNLATTYTHYTHLTQHEINQHMVYVKQNMLCLQEIHMLAEICL